MGKAVLIATHDPNLIRAAEERVAARVLRLAGRPGLGREEAAA